MTDKDNINTYLFKEVNLIQSVIKRMASNSFLIKGWSVTLIVVSLLLKGEKYHIFIAFIPLIIFWFLDSYFLQQERLYRKLYEWVIENRLNNCENLLSLDAKRFKNEVSSKVRIMFSITLGWFYGGIAILIIIYIVFLFFILPYFNSINI